MNKPTREQIEHRAIELMLEETKPDCTFCDYNDNQTNCAKYLCKSCLMKTALRKAEEELKDKLFLTDKQKNSLRNAIEILQYATGHRYEEFRYNNSDTTNKNTKFIWYTKKSDVLSSDKAVIITETHYDRISGCFVSFADEVFEDGKTYKIERILG